MTDQPSFAGEEPAGAGASPPGAEPLGAGGRRAGPAGAEAARQADGGVRAEGEIGADGEIRAERGIRAEGEIRAGSEADVEVVDGFPVLAEVRTIERVSPASLPAVQAAAAAATGFVAGAATVALVRRRSARKLARSGKNGPRRVADLLPITASRSFLVDVHVIGKPGD